MLVLEHIQGGSYRKWPADAKFEVIKPENSDEYEVEITIDSLSLINGVKYSIDVIGVNGALSSSLQHSHGVIVDTTPPVVSKVKYPNAITLSM